MNRLWYLDNNRGDDDDASATDTCALLLYENRI